MITHASYSHQLPSQNKTKSNVTNVKNIAKIQIHFTIV